MEGLERIAKSEYEKLSQKRKEEQRLGLLPDWMTTGGFQLFQSKYKYKDDDFKETCRRLATTAVQHLPEQYRELYAYKFMEVLWKGWLAASTPILSNMGTPKGMPVSCSGQYVEDSIDGFYMAQHELALLTKHGFGTSSNLSDIRPRGTPISSGGKASGVLDVITSCVDIMRKVAQGTSRRGAWAGYLDIEHGDFWEVAEYLERFHDDLNIGWIVKDVFVDKLNTGDEEAHKRWKRIMKIRAATGKGYILMIDHVNEQSPQMYKDKGIKVSASNLCMEIMLPSDDEHTFTCVLSSMNLSKYDEWKDTDAVETAIIFLDCVASEFLSLARGKRGFEKAVRFTEKSRALGLGALGYHTLLQKRSIPFESLEAHMLNNSIFSDMKKKADKATKWLAEVLGEPEWCKGYGVRNSHLIAIAPNTSSALICGGVSQGIEPIVANVYNQSTSAGELYRINPVFMELAKAKGKFTDELVDDILHNLGSVQHLDWLTDHEKEVFKTAFELDQKSIIRKALTRQPNICQGQSLNLFASTEEDEGVFSDIHQYALSDRRCKGLYYMRTLQGIQASKGDGECKACEG